jgi:hypothetical protein
MVTRNQIVQIAREYVGTPFEHQGRLKGYACDCVGLLLMVTDDLGLVDVHGRPLRRYDYMNYNDQPLDAFVHEECQRRLTGKPVSEMQDGDVLTLRTPSVPCHVAFVSTWSGMRCMIHAYNGIHKVVENVIDKAWYRRIEGCFAIPGVE